MTEAEWAQLLSLLTEQVALEARGRVRCATLLPLSVCAALCRAFGRSPQALAWLEAFSQPCPPVWQLQTEAEANTRDGAVDYVLNEELAEMEEADVALEAELRASFVPFEEPECDQQASRVYTLDRIPAALEKALAEYERFRIEPLNRLRDGSAVVDTTVAADRGVVLRFLGWLKREHEVAPNLHGVFGTASLGERVEQYLAFLRDERGCRFSTIANYVNSVISVASFVLETSDCEEGATLEPLLRMRGQAESQAKQDHLWKRKSPGWIAFEDAQRARAKAIEAQEAYRGSDAKQRLALVRDCLVLSFLTCQPPDRVGVLRKMRFGATLKRGEAPGAWLLDLTERRGQHKTAKFYGPSVTTINPLIGVWIDKYVALLRFDRVDEADSKYYLFPVSGDFGRCVAGSQWTQMIKAVFQRYAGVEVTPKTLRASFISWLKGQTDAPDVLKAAATAMRHKEDTQASSRYDVEANDRLVNAAVEYTTAFAKTFQPPCAPQSGSGGGGGGSGDGCGDGGDGGDGGGGGSGGGAPINAIPVEALDDWVLLPHQPKGYTFKAAQEQDASALYRLFEHRLKWQDAFSPGLSLHFSTFAGRSNGFTFTLPADADADAIVTIRARIDRAATRATMFRATGLARRRSAEAQAEVAATAAKMAVAVAPPAAPMLLASNGDPPGGATTVVEAPAVQAGPPVAPGESGVHAQLARLGFSLETAEGAGDCYVLSVLAGHEISAAQAANPNAATRQLVTQWRNAAVNLLVGSDPIDGIAASVVRVDERLPAEAAAASLALNQWRVPGHWQVPVNKRNEPPAFMFAVAAKLSRPVVSLELLPANETGARNYGKDALVYADRGFDGLLSRSQGATGETIQSYTTMPLTEVLAMIAISPRAYSVVRLDRDAQHFEPFVFADSMLAGGERFSGTDDPDPVTQRLASFGARWEDEKQRVIIGSYVTRERLEELCDYLDKELLVDTMVLHVPAFEYEFSRSSHGARHLTWSSMMTDCASNAADVDGDEGGIGDGGAHDGGGEGGDGGGGAGGGDGHGGGDGGSGEDGVGTGGGGNGDGDSGSDGGAPPVAPPVVEGASSEAVVLVVKRLAAHPHQAAPKPKRAKRARGAGKTVAVVAPAPVATRKRHPVPPPPSALHDKGARKVPPARCRRLGAATPTANVPSPALHRSAADVDDCAVPTFAHESSVVWARGYYNDTHPWFKARVVKLRGRFPPIHVAFLEDEGGNSNPLALPAVASAYLTAADVRPFI